MDEAFVVLTNETMADVLERGGSQAWRVGKKHVSQCAYLVCVSNNPNNNRKDAPASHRTAFLIGKISHIERPDTDRCSPESMEDRFKICFSEYAEISVEDAWCGSQNPIWYTDLDTLGISLDELEFTPVTAKTYELTPVPHTPVRPLSIAEAKSGLAATFGVDPSAIEIIIRA